MPELSENLKKEITKAVNRWSFEGRVARRHKIERAIIPSKTELEACQLAMAAVPDCTLAEFASALENLEAT